MWTIETNEGGVPRRMWWTSNLDIDPCPPNWPLTCSKCGGDLLAGRNATVCERGCAIRHETPVGWLEKHHPERRIGHNTWGTILKEVKDGARKLAAYDAELNKADGTG